MRIPGCDATPARGPVLVFPPRAAKSTDSAGNRRIDHHRAGEHRANAGRIPNYGERRRAGEAISTAFTESAVNQVISKRMVKKQQTRWTPRGAHLLLQIRTRVLNDQLANDFRHWYPSFTRAPDTAMPAA